MRQNVTSATTTTLIEQNKQRSGGVEHIQITNNSASDAIVSVYLDDGTDQFYYIKELVMPTATAFVLNENISFSSLTYALKVDNSGAGPDISITVL